LPIRGPEYLQLTNNSKNQTNQSKNQPLKQHQMKKNTIIAALSLVCAVGAFGQGQINFATRIGSGATAVLAPIYGVDPARPTTQFRGQGNTNGGTIVYGGPLLSGTGFTAALFGGLAPITDENSSSLGLVATTTFRTQANLVGHVIPPVFQPGNTAPTVPGVPGDSAARGTFQVRVWDNANGTIGTWAAAMANPALAHGSSELFTVPFPLGANAVTPPNLVGLTSFNLVVPEPGVIALGVLGLGALLLRRRK
jgi:hypothetical protein